MSWPHAPVWIELFKKQLGSNQFVISSYVARLLICTGPINVLIIFYVTIWFAQFPNSSLKGARLEKFNQSLKLGIHNTTWKYWIIFYMFGGIKLKFMWLVVVPTKCVDNKFTSIEICV